MACSRPGTSSNAYILTWKDTAYSLEERPHIWLVPQQFQENLIFAAYV